MNSNPETVNWKLMKTLLLNESKATRDLNRANGVDKANGTFAQGYRNHAQFRKVCFKDIFSNYGVAL